MSHEILVHALGLECGFDRIGFASAEAVNDPTRQRLDHWLNAGCQASMAYMERSRKERLNPQLWFPECRTVIVCLSNYFTSTSSPSGSDVRISRYALFRDYHRTIRRRLKNYSRLLSEHFSEASFRYAVDTGPVLERYWAERSGLGWIGKNCMLITPDLGSWTFIGILMTSLELIPDQPHRFHCGSCTRCLEACPTKAFVQPGVLDSRRCISYLTIEHRGDFSGQEPDYREWIFGCDICQEVCPWNRFAKQSSDQNFQPLKKILTTTRAEIESMTPAVWEEFSRGTAIRRTGLEGLKRNIRKVKTD